MALSEIEKLERRYAENPQGLTFAPLAEVHRKNGDVSRALELLRSGLTLHPDYIPASIVLGRCHLDLGDQQAAEVAFTHVLDLDGENVIALKALADICERLLRFGDSERWLQALLAVDRSNDEAREQLARVEAAHRQAETGSSTSPEAAHAATASESAGSPEAATTGEATTGEAATGEAATSESETLAEVGANADGPSAAASVLSEPEMPGKPMLEWGADDSNHPAETIPLTIEQLGDAGDLGAPPPDGIQIEQEVALEEPVEPLDGLVGRDDLSGVPEHIDLGREFQVETAEDIVLESSGYSEFHVANAAEELSGGRISTDPFGTEQSVELPALDPVIPELAPETPAATAPADAAAVSAPVPEDVSQPSPTAVESTATAPAATAPAATAPAELPTPAPDAPTAPWSAPVAEPPRAPEPDLVVTESMAELLLQQGHPAEALTVYRHLESRSTGDARFQEKIADLERATAEGPTPEPARAYSVQATHGQSVQSFLRGVLSARLPAAPAGPASRPEPARAAADPEGAPTRPAHDSLSLSSVFGEESTPTMPAVPTASAPAQGGVSFDEFFSASGTASTPRPARPSDAKSDDLDQFHAWLQNLKR